MGYWTYFLLYPIQKNAIRYSILPPHTCECMALFLYGKVKKQFVVKLTYMIKKSL